MVKLVMVRHGQSQWNLENRFTGWTDVDLSEHGIREAQQAGRLLRSHGYRFDIAFTSVLKRAIRTLWIIQDETDLMWIPVEKAWELNERHYGALQGLNKAETGKQYGQDQLKIWRRSYSTRPPALDVADPRHPRFDPRYNGLPQDMLPATESLEDTLKRVVPYWKRSIVPHLLRQHKVLIAAHGNSLRALVKYLDGIPDDEITELEIPTGIPLVYELDDNLHAQTRYYLAEPDAFAKLPESPAPQRPGKGLH